MANEPNTTGASSDTQGTQTPAPKFELKDGAMFVDGKKVTYESDLIAAKKSLQDQIEKAQSIHNEAIDKAKVDLSGVQSQLASANAKVQELEAAQQKAAAQPQATTPEGQAKQDTANQEIQDKLTKAEAKALELRVKNIMLQYPGHLTEEQLKSKTPDQLTALEEALGAVVKGRGPGNYAIGGGAGGTVPLDDFDRAKALLAATPIRGTRNEPQK